MKIDELGRITIPVDIRRDLNLNQGDRITARRHGGGIYIEKLGTHCVFCRSTEALTNYRGTILCENCQKKVMPVIK